VDTVAEDFFQERFNKNIKFYESKTNQDLEKNYEHIYNDIELKDIFLAELMIIKKLIIEEKESKKNTQINFDDYINKISELYNQIEKMSDTEIQNNINDIEMIIASSKLSLNSPVYFKVDIERLKRINISRELNQFIAKTKINGFNKEETNTILQEFKKEMEEEISKKENVISIYNNKISNLQEKINNIEDFYWKMNNHEIDLFEFIGKCFSIDLFTKEEKTNCLYKVNKIIQNNTPENVQALNDMISQISYRVQRDINYTKNSILNYEQYSSLIKKIAQCIDEKGRFIQAISNELLDECIKQIGYSKLNSLDLQLQILKEQSRIEKKQNINQVVRTIESRTKTLTRKYKLTESKNTVELPEEYENVLKNAKKIIQLELNSQLPNDEMKLDELESMFVEELQNEHVDKNKIDQIIIKDANNDECRLKFIVYGLNYQLDNISETNMKKSIELISQYISYYITYKKKKINEAEQQEKMKDEINGIEEKIENIISSYQEDAHLFENIPEESLQYLNAYINVDFDKLSSNQIDSVLNDIGYDYEFVVSYKAYKMLDDTIEEIKELLDIAREEKITEKDLKIIKEKFLLIRELKQQYDKSKQLYIENKQNNVELIQNKKPEDESIIIYFETLEGKTQAEERITEDSTKFGRYSQSDINSVQYLIKQLKNTSWDIIYKQLSDDIKPFENSYKKRRISKGKIRLAFIKLNSSSLKTEKPVYLIISIGKKMSNESDVYKDANKLKNEVLKFISEYEKLENAPENVIQEFLEKQKKNEERIIQCTINRKEESDVKKR